MRFWDWFNGISDNLGFRANTFQKMLLHLDDFDGPITIVETGCMRAVENWGDGCSTLIFDQYVSARNDGSNVKSVDISQQAVDVCKSLVTDKVDVICDDSVHFLSQFVTEARAANLSVPLFYLDSFDLDWTYWQPSAVHHLKELAAIAGFLKPETMVVVDDCMQSFRYVESEGVVTAASPSNIGGKGLLVAEFANSVNAELVFSEYQAGWKNFGA